MYRYSFDALVDYKGRVFHTYYEVDADSLRKGFLAAKQFFSNKYGEFEIVGYSLLGRNER